MFIEMQRPFISSRRIENVTGKFAIRKSYFVLSLKLASATCLSIRALENGNERAKRFTSSEQKTDVSFLC